MEEAGRRRQNRAEQDVVAERSGAERREQRGVEGTGVVASGCGGAGGNRRGGFGEREGERGGSGLGGSRTRWRAGGALLRLMEKWRRGIRE